MTSLQVIVTAGIAVLGLMIAWRQYQTARSKLRLDLYDRRYRVYTDLTAFINDLQGRVVPDDEYTTQARKLEQMPFLFDRPLNEWVHGLLRNARQMNNARRTCSRAQHNNPENISNDKLMQASGTYSRLTIEFDKHLGEAAERFLPYLDFRRNL